MVTAVSVLSALLLIVAGSAAFSGLAMLMAGTLRAEATLAAANLIYLVLLGVGGVVFPLTKFPAGARPVLRLLPSGALSDGLRAVLRYGSGLPVRDVVVLGRLGGRLASAWRRARSAGSSGAPTRPGTASASRQHRPAGQRTAGRRRATCSAGCHLRCCSAPAS